MAITIRNEDLAKLNPNEAVDLVRDLVQADAEESGIAPNKISFPSSISVPDGGIDGKVDGATKDSKQGTIKKGLTCYQIKTGDYRIDQQGIKKLFGDSDSLKPEINHCLKHGTLVIVLTGQDRPPTAEKERIYKYLGCRPSIEIWGQNTLIGYLKRYHTLCLLNLKIRDSTFCYYDDWAGQEDMSHELVTGREQDAFIADLGRRLLSETLTEHIRITGGHGIGKTRLVLEALRPDRLSRLCIYTREPGRFMESEFFKYLVVPGDRVRAILVVDGCPDDDMVDIWNRVNKHGNRIKLVTIYDKPSQSRHHMKSLPVPTLDNTQIKQILESYVEPPYKADVWYKECTASPRAAHFIGENLRSNPHDILRQPGNSGWDRFIAYRTNTNDEAFGWRKTVLLWIGQLRRFGYGKPYTNERKIMEGKIEEQTGIRKGALAAIIEELRQMKILHGSDILYIAPKTLHVWLWREWYRKYGALEPFPLDDMWKRAKSDVAYRNVLEWHVDMWQYDKADSPHRAVKDVFSPGGFADRHSLLGSYFGADLLHKMAKARLGDAVGYLERYMGALDMDGLRQFSAGRRQAAMILVEAAGCRNLFRRAARVLLLLAGTGSQEAEGPDNMFARLFLPAAGPVGWTETPPIERVPILKEALGHGIAGCRLTAIKACEAALQTNGFIKDIVPDEAWQRGGIWEPTRWDEYTKYYRRVLNTVRTSLKSLDEPEQRQLSKAVLSCTRSLLKFAELHDTELCDDVLSVLDEMHDGRHAAPELMIETISDCLSYGGSDMAVDLRDKLRLLHDRIVGDSYHGLMRRHIAMNVFSDINMPKDKRREIVATLAKQSLDNPEDLNREMAWLVTDEAAHGDEFGCALGKMDDGSMFSGIRDAQRQCSKSRAAFLGGYLNAVFHRDIGEWERLMDSLAADTTLHELIPALTNMSGMTDKAAVRILELVESKVEPLALRDFRSCSPYFGPRWRYATPICRP